MSSTAGNADSQTELSNTNSFERIPLTQRRSGMASPERGRKLRRELGPLRGVLSGQVPSSGSCNIRGRRRHRSTSLASMASPSRNNSRSGLHHEQDIAVGDRAMNRTLSGLHNAGDRSSRASSLLREALRLDSRRRKRSQSPSRSRSPAGRLASGMGPGSKKMAVSPARRRHRTRSRSRKHSDVGLGHVLASGTSPLLFEVVVEGGRTGKQGEEPA